MSYAGWGELWKQVLALLSAEPVFLRIFAVSMAAFCAVVFLEGLRACFLPGYRKVPAMALPAPPAMAKGRVSVVFEEAKAREPFRPRSAQSNAVNRKKPVNEVHIGLVLRPKIRRVPLERQYYSPPPMFTEEVAPYSPVPSAPVAV